MAQFEISDVDLSAAAGLNASMMLEKFVTSEVDAENIAVSLTSEEAKLILRCDSCDEFKLRAEIEILDIESKRVARRQELDAKLKDLGKEQLICKLSGAESISDDNFKQVKSYCFSIVTGLPMPVQWFPHLVPVSAVTITPLQMPVFT